MKRLALTFAIASVGALCLAAPAAQADFGLRDFDVAFVNEDGTPATQAGSHPFAVTTKFDLNTKPGEPGRLEGELKDLNVAQIAGLVGAPGATPRCPTQKFLERIPGLEATEAVTSCPDSSAVGVVAASLTTPDSYLGAAVYNLVPPPGVAAKLGFAVLPGIRVTIELSVNPNPPYNVIAKATGAPQVLDSFGVVLTVWGNPASSAHDPYRGFCVALSATSTGEPKSRGNCPTGAAEEPFLTLPRACQGPLQTTYAADSWLAPGTFLPSGEPDLADPRWVTGSSETHDDAIPPNPQGMTECGKLGFNPSITAKPTTKAASSPTGLDFSLDVGDEGLTSPKAGATANSDVRKALVTLPEGFTVNPSIAEGLEVCSEADLKRETAFSDPGEGCPQASKIGTIEVETPLLEDKLLKGSLYVAKPYANPFGSLIAFYIVIKNPELGIKVIQPARVEPNLETGQLVTTTEAMPQLPFSHFRLHFKEGPRSPLITPPACGTYHATAKLFPYSGGPSVTSTSAFEVISGPDNSSCPSGGLPPFRPELLAGTINNAAGHFSPFDVKITRTDAEQEVTHFSIKLPPGVAGKLAGVPFCTDAQIAQASARTGPHGGQEELDDPSCPAASQVGRSLAGSGVGPSLAYAPGKVYLAGPYHGRPVSLVAITAGVVGPFDIGTVLVRLAIDVNPETGEVFLDSTGSDPIPHIVKGIPIHLRDIRAYTDRPEFTFNPTSCEPTSTSSTVLGSGLDFVSPDDDNPLVVSTRFQAADCAALPFKPKLTLRLKGSHKRRGNPALKAHLAMNGFGEAGLAYAQVALPKSLFLDNAHIGTICTRVQFRQGAVEGENCPAGSVIGSAKAVTPILSEALEGPIYLRSSERQLPDIAAALQGQEIHVVAIGHTDSAPGGGLRNTFEVIPDAPISTVDINLFGGKRGLILNSQNLCKSKPKATVKFRGHNGKLYEPNVKIQPSGCKKAKKKSKRHARRP